MIKFENLKMVHLEISNNCQASCPMCARNVCGGQSNPLIKVNNWTTDDFKRIITQEVIDQVENVYFCGNFGDPILNNDLIDMCEYFTKSNGKQITIHTNGGVRHDFWWRNLAKVLPKNHRIIFAIDGLEDTNHIYRIGVNYKNVIRNARAFINAGGNAEWAFIRFKHNEHQELEAKELAKEYGFNKFTVKHSSRFVIEPRHPVTDKDGNLLYYIEPPTTNTLSFIDKDTIDNIDNFVNQSTVDCFVQKTQEVYIDCYKNLYPCCWVGAWPYSYIKPNEYTTEIRHRFVNEVNAIIENFGGVEQLNVLTRPIKDIIDSTEYQTLWSDAWEAKKLLVCSRICGHLENSFSKPTEQFIEITKLHD